MGKFRCVCNNVISTSGNSDDEWLVIREREFEEIEEVGSGTDGVYEKARKMYVCPVSGHVWIFWSGWSVAASCYEPRTNVVVESDQDVGIVSDSG